MLSLDVASNVVGASIKRDVAMFERMTVLVTGGAGYIGSHMVLALLDAGHRPVIIDDF